MITALILLGLAALLVFAASTAEVALLAFPLNRIAEPDKSRRLGAQHLAVLRAQPAGLLSALWTLRVAGAALAIVGGIGDPAVGARGTGREGAGLLSR
jgi:hypothetical protein